MNEKTEIDMNKKYKTRSGLPARVICTDMQDAEYPVVALVKDTDGEASFYYTKEGKFVNYEDKESPFDIIEVTPWDDFKIDDPVMVCDNYDGKRWYKRHFAGIENGYPQAFYEGMTSWTGTRTTMWSQCRKPTPEELNQKADHE